MAERWVVNASPLISLARIGREWLLTEIADEVVIPEDVATEVLAGPDDRASQLISTGWVPIVSAPLPPDELVAWDLGRGETAVLSLVLTDPSWTAILDDSAARRCARSFGLKLKGCLAVAILARKRGLIDSAAQLLRSLRASGFHLSDPIVRDALRATLDEDWPGS